MTSNKIITMFCSCAMISCYIYCSKLLSCTNDHHQITQKTHCCHFFIQFKFILATVFSLDTVCKINENQVVVECKQFVGNNYGCVCNAHKRTDEYKVDNKQDNIAKFY